MRVSSSSRFESGAIRKDRPACVFTVRGQAKAERDIPEVTGCFWKMFDHKFCNAHYGMLRFVKAGFCTVACMAMECTDVVRADSRWGDLLLP